MIDVYRDIIGLIAHGCGYTDILELGCEKFGCTNVIRKYNPQARITCVDHVRRADPPHGVRLVKKTTDEFFRAETGMYDLIFVDADHSAVAADKDIRSSLAVLRPLGTIVVHDTDPITEVFSQPQFCGDSFKVLPNWAHGEVYDVCTLPMEKTGLTLIRRSGDTRVAQWM